MITIQPENFKPVGLAHAVALMEPFAGRRVGVGEPLPSLVDETSDAESVLNYFYNGGAFRGIRAAMRRGYIRDEQDEGGTFRSMRYTFAEAVREGHTGTIMSVPLSGPSVWFEERRYIAQYYPDAHCVAGESAYLDRRKVPREPVYSVSATPSGLSYAEGDEVRRPPVEEAEVVIAKRALQRLVYDIARDVALALSGA